MRTYINWCSSTSDGKDVEALRTSHSEYTATSDRYDWSFSSGKLHILLDKIP